MIGRRRCLCLGLAARLGSPDISFRMTVRQRLTDRYNLETRVIREQAMSTRISARLDDATQAKLESIQAQTGRTVTELVAEALDLYYRMLRADNLESNRALLSLAGIFKGPPSLSERVKEEFTEALDGKHAGHR
ncbi:hypothetical protein GCM10023089_19020 [Quisquiliibacterium transsilvanicum]